MGYAASMAIRDRIAADGLTAEQIATLYAALPARAARSEDESAVALGLSLAHSAVRRAAWADLPTDTLADMAHALTTPDGRYVDGGEGFASSDAGVIDGILSARHGVDVWEAWEAHPDHVPTDHAAAGARYRDFQRAFWQERANGA